MIISSVCRWLVLILVSLTCFIISVVAKDAPALQLASKYHQDVEIRQYWVSEKLDGVRARWNGEHLISRGGHIFAAPAWFLVNFPNEPLDGELWIARDSFDLVSGIVRQKHSDNPRWQQIKFMLFDLPKSSLNFDSRINKLHQLVAQAQSPYLQMIEQKRLANNIELNNWLDSVVAHGGEGLMLHKASAVYQTSRSPDLMKFKKSDDAEAVVLEHLGGRGQFSGMLGSLLVELPDGVRFKIGSGFSHAQRKAPPAIGSTITFKYYGKTKKGVPRFASFMRVRTAM